MMAAEESIPTRNHHRSIPPIYLSCSNQTGFIERYFVVKLYDKIVESGFGDGIIWFDHHQGIHPDKVNILFHFDFLIDFIFSRQLGLLIVLRRSTYRLVVF